MLLGGLIYSNHLLILICQEKQNIFKKLAISEEIAVVNAASF